MDIPDMTLREIVQSNPVSNTEPDGHKTSEKWFEKYWNVIFVISCLFAVLTDPLFLYVPLINQDVNCIRLDHKLKIAAVFFRSITDFVYAVKIIFQIYELKKVTAMAIWRRSYIILDILAILPIPQVTILIYFTKMSGSRSLNTRKFLNFLVLIQYVPRLLRIYLACKEIKNSPKGKLGLWIKGGLNFLMYIVVGHIIGGFWYFFSVQRMLDCWQHACRDENGCKPSTFHCQDHPTNNTIKLLNDSCPISPSNATVFDFGIFLNALQSGLVGSTDYSRKLSNCFWWGLRNLSSLGSNLQPSVNTWENLFAAFTSIVGLLLFLYLLGNLQMYMQVEPATSKERLRWQTDLENMMRTERKMRIERRKVPEVEKWLTKNGYPMRLMPEIMSKVVQVDLEQNRDVNVENILLILPLELQSYILVYKEKLKQEGGKIELWLSENRLPMRLKSEIIEAVAQRPEFEQNGVEDVNIVLTMLPPRLKVYIESYMQKLREKEEEIDMWLSENDLPKYLKSEIMETVQLNFEENKDIDVKNILSILPVPLQERIRECLRLVIVKRKIEEKGEEIDMWMLKNGIPKSHKSNIEEAVRKEINKDVDIDVENFISIYPTTVEIQDFLPLNRLKEIPLLETLDEGVLKAACEHLKVVKYDSDKFIIQEGEPLEMILFVEGYVTFEKRDLSINCRDCIWGQELLVWPSSTSFPAELLIATDTLSPKDCEVTALVLTADDMESIGSTFRPKFDQLTSHWLTRLKKVPKLECMDEEVLKAIFLHLKQAMFSSSTYYIENEPVPSMNFIIEGFVEFTTKDDNCEDYIRREGEVYGEELLDWVLDTSFPILTPYATHTAKASYHGYADPLSITAEELKSVGSKFRSYFSTLRKEPQPDLFTVVGLTMLKRVQELRRMDEEVLKAISQHLKYKEYNEREVIIEGGNPVDRMLFLLSGGLHRWTKKGDLLADTIQFYGQELIEWLTSSFHYRPLPIYTVTARGKTRLLVLMANDLESVVSKYKLHF